MKKNTCYALFSLLLLAQPLSAASYIEEKKIDEDKKYTHELGIYQQQYNISDVGKWWDYSTLYYGQETPLGKVFGKLNYANRSARQALQGEIEAYPKINKYLYFDLDFAFANDPNLFPSQVYGAEAYVNMGKTFDVSAGAKYNRVDERHQFTTYTGSLAKGIENNLITFRPYYFVPNHGSTSLLYTLNFRHFIQEPSFYVGFLLGTGTSPDLADLQTVDFIVLKNKIISPYINFPLFHEQLIVNLAYLYQHQEFPRGRIRNWNGGTVGLAWRF